MSDTANVPAKPEDKIDTTNAEERGTILAEQGTAEDNPWEKGALIVAGAPKAMPTKGDRMVIVVENRLALPEDFDKNPDPEFTSADDKATYPKKADIYFGYANVADSNGAEAARIFPDAGEGEVILMGDNVRQASHTGLTRKSGFLSVGPAHPVYAAVNLAWQRGARDVKVVGLRDDEREKLRPWFDEISPEFEKLEYGG